MLTRISSIFGYLYLKTVNIMTSRASQGHDKKGIIEDQQNMVLFLVQRVNQKLTSRDEGREDELNLSYNLIKQTCFK